MLLNQNTILTSPEYSEVILKNQTSNDKRKFLFLVPYRHCHVPTYHQWMRSNELLKATASEPLSLDEEYEMQKSWMNDSDKLTFILLYRETWDPTNPTLGMIGDVNLFLNDPDDAHSAEIEIMIAEPWARGKGLAAQSLIWMMMFGAAKLRLHKYKAVIGWENQASLSLFTKKLGFQCTHSVAVFKETHFELQWHEFENRLKNNFIELQW